MKIAIRRAIPSDAETISTIAQSLSLAGASAKGGSLDNASNAGFLLYPLATSDPGKPNYAQRIAGSSHFWVAEVEGTVVAYRMMYAFSEMKQFKHKTANDEGVLAYFLGTCGFDDSIIYSAQIGCDPSYQRKGLMKTLTQKALCSIKDAPALVSEIAQSPVLNRASTRMATKHAGMRLIATRSKDDGARISGVFMRTL
jgi:hypothetical protein